jgi:hypothetical protein
MPTRDFDDATLAADWTAILSQAGITFSCQGSTVTGVWGPSGQAFTEFEDQRRDEVRFTVFLTTGQLGSVPAVASTLTRAGVTYFVSRVELDAEGTGLMLDVEKAMR